MTGSGETLPFLLETKLLSLGADYRAGADFTSYVVVDENLITGQNPGSAVETAIRLLERLRSKEKNTITTEENGVEKYPSHDHYHLK